MKRGLNSMLTTIVALGVALAGSTLLVGPADPPVFPERRRPWLCRLRMHRFVGCYNPDGDFYLQCRRCGVDHYELVPVKNGNVIGNLFSQFPG